MKYLTMTASQTRRYELDDPNVLTELREQARKIREGSETIEIYTDDGIVADVIEG